MKGLIWIAVSSAAQATADKISLPEQRRACEQYAQDNDIEIVDTLIVPGESRAAIDIVEFDKLPAAYPKLRDYWQRGGIDALVVYEVSRLGRSQSLLTYVLENMIRNGIDVHVVEGGAGVITPDNYRGHIAIGGFATTSHMDSFRKKVRAAWERKAALGLPVTGHVPFTHTIVRDSKGREQRVIVRPELRPFLTDLARLLLDRVAWERLPDELAELGHYDSGGEPYHYKTIYDTVHKPIFWGNQGLGYGNLTGNPGLWIFDASIPAPDGVMMWYDTELAEPAYTGALADAIQDELRRRTSTAMRARGDSGIRAFTTLAICGACGSGIQMRAKNNDYGYVYYGCRLNHKRYGYRCDENKFVRTDTMQAFITDLLQTAIDSGLESVMHQDGAVETGELESLSSEKTDIEKQIQTLIRKQATAPPELADMYDDELERLAQRLSAISTRRNQLEQAVKRNQIRGGQIYALEDIRNQGIEALWELPPARQNQLLQRVLGNYRMVISGGEIIGLSNQTI